VVAAGRVDGYACRLVDDNDIVVFVDDADWRSSDWWLMSMRGVGYNVAILDRSGSGGHRLAIEDNGAAIYGIFLGPMMC